MAYTTAQLAEQLEQAGLGAYVDAIMPYATPIVRLHGRPCPDPAARPLGATFIGGLPDMPPNTAWPTRKGRPCEFIAQINLDDVAPLDQTGLLPREGLLLFFFDGEYYEDKYDPNDMQRGSETIVYYTGDLSLLQRVTDYPTDLKEWQRYSTCDLVPEQDWMLPTWWCEASIRLAASVFGRIPLQSDEPPDFQIYKDLSRRLEPYPDDDKHHLLGYPQPLIQDDALYDVLSARGLSINEMRDVPIEEWPLLLQISSNDCTNMMWADTSSLYYYIHRDDLIARRFENAYCEVQFL